jgi:hypothetical protein
MASDMKDAGVMDGILMWTSAVILVVIMLPVISGVIGSTPVIMEGPFNVTQQTVYSTAASSFNLIGIIPIVIAAVVILGVVALLGFRRT